MEFKCLPMFNSNNNQVIAFLCNKAKNIENFSSINMNQNTSVSTSMMMSTISPPMMSPPMMSPPMMSPPMMSSPMMYSSISSDTK